MRSLLRAVALAVLLAVLAAPLAAPLAEAKPFLLRSDDQRVDGDFVIPAMGDEGWEKDLFVITGRMRVDGETNGPFLFLNATAGSVSGAETVEVYRVSGGQSYQDFVPRVFENATVELAEGSDVAWLPPTGDVDGSADFAAAVFLDVLAGNADLRRVRTGATPAGLLASVHGGAFATEGFDDDGEGFLVPLSAASGFTVFGEEIDQSPFPSPGDGDADDDDANESEGEPFGGKDFVVRFLGTTEAAFEAPLVHVPFTAGTEATFAPAAPGDFERGFDLGAFQELLTDMQDLASGDDAGDGAGSEGPDGDGGGGDGAFDSPEFRQLENQLDDLAPLLNGVLVGSPRGEVTVDGADHDKAGLTVVRFTELTFTSEPGSDNVQWDGGSRVTYTDGGLQTSAEMVHVGPLFFPVLGLLLWAVAVAMIVFEKSKRPPTDDAKSAQAKIPALVTWLVLLVVSFVLWDREVRYLVGTSLLSGAGSGASTGAVAFLELFPWSVAYLAFGLPIVLAAKAGLRFGGLDQRAKGFAKGAGALATWFLGAPYILPIAGEFVRTLVGFFK